MNEFYVNKNILVCFQLSANSIKALEPINLIQSTKGGTYVFQAKLGLCIAGTMNTVSAREICCNRNVVKQTDTDVIGRYHLQI